MIQMFNALTSFDNAALSEKQGLSKPRTGGGNEIF
jgi:hypothetical protein